MSTGLLALIDDVIAITKIAASSVDDVSVQVAKASSKAVSKAAGIVIDDTAVTPRYVVGFAAERELPIIKKIAVGSLRNKILILLPGAVLLSSFTPWLIVPLLMIGGAFLCFEGWHKVSEFFFPHSHSNVSENSRHHTQEIENLEQVRTDGAIQTDFILSAEIMAITLSSVTTAPVWIQVIVLAVVGIGITAAVYGAVAVLVKMDDLGVYLAQQPNGVTRQCGRIIVRGMPFLLQALSVVGTLAMLWVGGGILIHGLHELGVHAAEQWLVGIEAAVTTAAGSLAGWVAKALLAGVLGLVVGATVAISAQNIVTPVLRSLKTKHG